MAQYDIRGLFDNQGLYLNLRVKRRGRRIRRRCGEIGSADVSDGLREALGFLGPWASLTSPALAAL